MRSSGAAVSDAPRALSTPLRQVAGGSSVAPNRTEEDIVPEGRGSNLKNRDMYEELRKDGASKEKAARISNAAANEGESTVGRRGGQSGSYEDWTVDELKGRAKELGFLETGSACM